MSRIEVWIIGQGSVIHYGGTFYSWHTVLASLPGQVMSGATRWAIFPVGRPSAIQLQIILV